MATLVYLLAFLVPLGATILLIPPIRSFCLRRGLVDSPGGRKQHETPRPRLAGLAIFMAFTSTVLAGFMVAPVLASLPLLRTVSPQIMAALAEAWQVKSPLVGLLAGGTIIFVVGIADDLLGERLSTGRKLAGQCLAAGVAVGAGIRVEFLGSEAANAIVSLLWIVGMSNAFNLLDNMNGLAAGVAVMSSAIFLVNAAELGEIFICLILTAFIGCLVGFLRFNFPRASVFMGDGGALFIGFILSSLTVLEHYVSPASSNLFPVLMPPLVLAVPLLDTLSVICIRIRQRRPVHVGDRCHLSHRLVRSGLSETQAAVFLYLVTLGLGLGALHLAHASPLRSLWIGVDSALLGALVLWAVRFGDTWRADANTPASTRSSDHVAEGV